MDHPAFRLLRAGISVGQIVYNSQSAYHFPNTGTGTGTKSPTLPRTCKAAAAEYREAGLRRTTRATRDAVGNVTRCEALPSSKEAFSSVL
jgi:hypothetical protein